MYLLVFDQTFCIAQSFVVFFHLQQQRFAVAKGATVCTSSHGQIVYSTETVKAGVAADFMNRAAQDDLMFALEKG